MQILYNFPQSGFIITLSLTKFSLYQSDRAMLLLSITLLHELQPYSCHVALLIPPYLSNGNNKGQIIVLMYICHHAMQYLSAMFLITLYPLGHEIFFCSSLFHQRNDPKQSKMG